MAGQRAGLRPPRQGRAEAGRQLRRRAPGGRQGGPAAAAVDDTPRRPGRRPARAGRCSACRSAGARRASSSWTWPQARRRCRCRPTRRAFAWRSRGRVGGRVPPLDGLAHRVPVRLRRADLQPHAAAVDGARIAVVRAAGRRAAARATPVERAHLAGRDGGPAGALRLVGPRHDRRRLPDGLRLLRRLARDAGAAPEPARRALAGPARGVCRGRSRRTLTPLQRAMALSWMQEMGLPVSTMVQAQRRRQRRAALANAATRPRHASDALRAAARRSTARHGARARRRHGRPAACVRQAATPGNAPTPPPRAWRPATRRSCGRC